MIENIILDWDGTVTEIELESNSFQQIYPKIFCESLKIQQKDKNAFAIAFNDAEDMITDNPLIGFVIFGHDAIPACSDPYIRTQKTAQIVLEKIIGGSLKIDCEIPDDTDQFMIDLYSSTIKQIPAKTNAHFRKKAQEFLYFASDRFNSAIVTNSKTNKVEKQLEILDIDGIPIKGEANKLRVYDDFEAVPEYIQPEGFPRKVLLRRKDYCSTLKDLGFSPEKTAVIGDIYELDLALPEHLGYTVVQIRTRYTPYYEKKYQVENNFFAKDLADVAEFLLKNST